MCWGGGPLPWGVSPGLGDKKGSWAVPEERRGGGGALPALPGGLLDLGSWPDPGWAAPSPRDARGGTFASCVGTVPPPPRPLLPAGCPVWPARAGGGGAHPSGLTQLVGLTAPPPSRAIIGVRWFGGDGGVLAACWGFGACGLSSLRRGGRVKRAKSSNPLGRVSGWTREEPVACAQLVGANPGGPPKSCGTCFSFSPLVSWAPTSHLLGMRKLLEFGCRGHT